VHHLFALQLARAAAFLVHPFPGFPTRGQRRRRYAPPRRCASSVCCARRLAL